MGTTQTSRRRPGRAVALCLIIVLGAIIAGWRLVGVPVYRDSCGWFRLHYAARTWYAPAPDARTTRPEAWIGDGVLTSLADDRLVYRDWSGTTVVFPGSTTPPTGCL